MLIPCVCFVAGLVDTENVEPSQPHLVIIDYLMDFCDKRVENFFTKICHPMNTSSFYIGQNLFNHAKGHGSCSINCQYMVAFRNSRECQQIAHLARQIYPGESKTMTEAFWDATANSYSYLLSTRNPQHLTPSDNEAMCWTLSR